MDEETLLAAIQLAVLKVGGNIVGKDENGLLIVETADSSHKTINLHRVQNLLKNKTETVESALRRFLVAENYYWNLMADPRNQKPGLRLVLERTALQQNCPLIHRFISDQLIVALEWMAPEENGLVLLNDQIVADWPFTVDEAWEIAAQNMEDLLNRAPIEFIKDEGQAIIALFNYNSPLKASLILAPNLKKHVSEQIGWPVLAVAPCRDFLYVFPSDERLAKVQAAVGEGVRTEYTSSAYNLSTEVLQISDEGIEAIALIPVTR